MSPEHFSATTNSTEERLLLLQQQCRREHQQHQSGFSYDSTIADDNNNNKKYLQKDGGDESLKGQATVLETVLNLMKTCMGTGCLALAFACQQGGIVVYSIGLIVIAGWNVICVQRLCMCLALLPTGAIKTRSRQEPADVVGLSSDEPVRSASLLGLVAWHAYGSYGLIALDVMFGLLLLGIIVSYVAATISFLGDTPLGWGIYMNAMLSGIAMAFLSIVPDVGYLSRASGFGLLVLLVAFLVIFSYGIVQHHDKQQSEQLHYHDASITVEYSNTTTPIEEDTALFIILNFWPASFTALSHWFGVAVFGYGIVPLTYHFHQSMAEPNQLVAATGIALSGVTVLYLFMGIGLYILFPSVQGEIMHELPSTGIFPIGTRLAMVWVVLSTAPLLIVPCAELIEGRLNLTSSTQGRISVRFAVCAIAVGIAVFVPNFVQVLALVGCACVGVVSFCLPPLLHVRLICLMDTTTSSASTTTMGAIELQHRRKRQQQQQRELLVDILLLLWGMFATLSGTIYTFAQMTTSTSPSRKSGSSQK